MAICAAVIGMGIDVSVPPEALKTRETRLKPAITLGSSVAMATACIVPSTQKLGTTPKGIGCVPMAFSIIASIDLSMKS